MNKRDVGTFYEDIAAEYIRNNGGKIIKRNYRSRQGEIDIIARDGEYLCFVEVKDALEAVGFAKQKTVCKVSKVYIRLNGGDFDTPMRYDVIAVNASEDGMYNVKWLKNAFEYVL